MSKATAPDPGTLSVEAEALLERVRTLVREELRQGAEPADLSFVLAFVATELGMAIASDPLQVFPVVLDAVTRATLNRVRASADAEKCDAPRPPTRPLDAKVH